MGGVQCTGRERFGGVAGGVIDGWMAAWVGGWVGGWVGEWGDGCMDVWTDGSCMDGWDAVRCCLDGQSAFGTLVLNLF